MPEPDYWYFKQLDQKTDSPLGTKVVLSGSVEAWTCECYWVNGEMVDRCNYCGKRKADLEERKVTNER